MLYMVNASHHSVRNILSYCLLSGKIGHLPSNMPFAYIMIFYNHLMQTKRYGCLVANLILQEIKH